MAGAKFCVECGRPIVAASTEADADTTPSSGRSARARIAATSLTTAFIVAFAAITVIGLGAAGWILLRTPTAGHQQAASESAVAQNGTGSPIPNGNASNPMGGTVGNNAPNQLPVGHPRVQLPTEARSFIDKIEKDAKAKPKDINAWNELGNVTMRAAMFDDSYYTTAETAYAHVLELDPNNTTALRGVGDIDYDTNKYDQAVAAYEHYLKEKPNDPEVRTDLGSMYLYTGNADQALIQYQRAIKLKPDMFQAYYNMGVAFAQENKNGDAQAALKKAYTLAPDDNARNQVKDLMGKIAGASGTLASLPGGGAAATSNEAAPPSQPAITTPATTFQGDLEKIVRAMPVVGPKVGSFQWPSKNKARMLMENFPMDQMPPFAKHKFLSDIKSSIDAAKKDYKVTDHVQLQIVDSASGHVMETVTE